MAFKTVPEKYLGEFNKKKAKQKTSEMITSVTSRSKEATHRLTDSLVLLTISFWYFFFTGLAIILKRDVPKEWFRIGKDINRGRIARKIKNLPLESHPEGSEPGKARKFKVVDIDTKQPLKEMKLGSSAVPKVRKTPSTSK